MQSSAWARLKGLSGWRVARLVVTRQDFIVGGAQLLLRALPFLGGVGYVSKGPLIAVDDVQLHRLVIKAVHRVARAHRAQVLVVQPPGNAQILARLLPGWGFRSNPKIGTLTHTV
jgi:lipid II:glycine glycyltransferase (peptidoglycan interpeptide bridge formation enzyme)